MLYYILLELAYRRTKTSRGINMNTKLVLGAFVVLFVMTISATTAMAETEEVMNRIDLHTSFRNVDENGIVTITTIEVVKYYDKTYLFTGQDIRDKYDNPVSFALGIQILEDEELQIQKNLQYVELTVPKVTLGEWYLNYTEIELEDLKVKWKSNEKAEIIHYNQQDSEYPKFKDLSLNCEGTAVGSINNSSLGDCFHSRMNLNVSTYKVGK